MANVLLYLAVSVTLFSLSKASDDAWKQKCSDYDDQLGFYHYGLSCPNSTKAHSDQIYCCMSFSDDHMAAQWCCTKTDWDDQHGPDKKINYWGVAITVGLAVIFVVPVAIVIARAKARCKQRIRNNLRGPPPTAVVTVNSTQVGPYQQFQNPPIYTSVNY